MTGSPSGPSGPAGPAERPAGPAERPAPPVRPDQAEVAAIVAAVELLWPRPVVYQPPVTEGSLWRFSGRWWARPVPARRHRPW